MDEFADKLKPMEEITAKKTSKESLQKRTSRRSLSSLLQQCEDNTEYKGVEQNNILLKQVFEGNRIFKDYNIDLNDYDFAEQLWKCADLRFSETPEFLDVKENQLILVLEGQAFLEMQNQVTTQDAFKQRVQDKNDKNGYVFLKKMCSGDYFVSYEPTDQIRYVNRSLNRNYLIMTGERTLLAIVSKNMSLRHFATKIKARSNEIITALSRVGRFSKLNPNALALISQFTFEERATRGKIIIKKGVQSEDIYIVKEGEIELRYYKDQSKKSRVNCRSVTHQGTPFSIFIKRANEEFGMELETQPEANLGEWSAEALCECVFHRINKKILTIIISAHSPTPKRRFRCGSPINMNAMITDCSFLLQKKMLLQNISLFHSAQKKRKHLKLKNQNQKRSQEKHQSTPIRQFSPPSSFIFNHNSTHKNQRSSQYESPRSSKTAINKFISLRNVSNLRSSTPRFHLYNSSTRNYNSTDTFKNKVAKVNNVELQEFQELQFDKINIRTTTTWQNYQPRLSSRNNIIAQQKFEQFVPRLTAKLKLRESSAGKIEKDMIQTLLDQKKNMMARIKTEKVSALKIYQKQKSTKNIKKIYLSNAKSKKETKETVNDSKTDIGNVLLQKMSNLRQNPLLLKVEAERKRLQQQMMSMQKAARKKKLHKKTITESLKEDKCILIQENP